MGKPAPSKEKQREMNRIELCVEAADEMMRYAWNVILEQHDTITRQCQTITILEARVASLRDTLATTLDQNMGMLHDICILEAELRKKP